MKESIVEINGHQYRYGYDPDTQKTKYLGPVGDAPAISQAEFMLVIGWGSQGQVHDYPGGRVAKESKWDDKAVLREYRAFKEFEDYTWVPKQIELFPEGMNRPELDIVTDMPVLVREKGNIIMSGEGFLRGGAPLTMEELKEIEEAIVIMWERGYADVDALQVARREDESWFFFDMGGVILKKDDPYNPEKEDPYYHNISDTHFTITSSSVRRLATTSGIKDWEPQTVGFLKHRLKAHLEREKREVGRHKEYWAGLAAKDIRLLKEMGNESPPLI